MDKRTFLKLSLSSASFLAVGSFGVLSKKQQPKLEPKRLSCGEAYEVESAERLWLPKSPKVGDHIFIKVSKKGLSSGPDSRIIYEKDKILGLSEDLELDQLANIKLIYGGAQKGWQLLA